MADDRMYFCHPASGYAVLISKMLAMDWGTTIANNEINNFTNWLYNNPDESIKDKFWDWYVQPHPKPSPFVLLFDSSMDPPWEFEEWPPIEFNGTKIYKVKLGPKPQ